MGPYLNQVSDAPHGGLHTDQARSGDCPQRATTSVCPCQIGMGSRKHSERRDQAEVRGR